MRGYQFPYSRYILTGNSNWKEPYQHAELGELVYALFLLLPMERMLHPRIFEQLKGSIGEETFMIVQFY